MKLLELRKKEHKSQSEIAKFLNVAQQTYAGYESEKTEPTIETLKKLSKYYNVSVDYLIENDSNYLLDTSNYNEYKKGVIYALGQLNEKNDLILLGYITHMLAEQMKEDK